MAAVEATDCAMEGTVNWANRDDGRPARTIGAASLAEADRGAGEDATASGLAGLGVTAALTMALAGDFAGLAATLAVFAAGSVLTFFTTCLTFSAVVALVVDLTGALVLAATLAKTLAGWGFTTGFCVNGFLLVGLAVFVDLAGLAIGLDFAKGLLPDLTGALALTAVKGFADLVFTGGLALAAGFLMATLAAGLAVALACVALATLATGFLLTALVGAALALTDWVGLTGLAFTWELLAG